MTTVTRYKLHLQVIDTTGSTTFTLFNSLVATYIGRTADQLIRDNNQVEILDFINKIGASYHSALPNTSNWAYFRQFQRQNPTDIPDEFNAFFGKEFLFKVHVADINVTRGWQTFTVKKFTSDSSNIQEFIHKHGLHVCR